MFAFWISLHRCLSRDGRGPSPGRWSSFFQPGVGGARRGPRAEHFKEVLARRQFASIVIGGGSPCQGNTSLHAGRKGLQDEHSRQPQLLHDMASELNKITRVPVLSFLENVASAPPEVVHTYTQWVGGSPIQISADSWGWVHRKRLFNRFAHFAGPGVVE